VDFALAKNRSGSKGHEIVGGIIFFIPLAAVDAWPGNAEVIQKRPLKRSTGLVPTSRLVRIDSQKLLDHGQTESNPDGKPAY
jgi:hypothetical protein